MRATENQRQAASDVLRRWASYAGVGNALVLIVVKVGAWLVTGSLALLTSALDAGVDVIASFATFVAVRYARRPPDLSHRFGHGKAESLAAFLQAFLLAGAALALIVEAIRRFISPQPLSDLEIGLAVIGASLLVTAGLVLFQSHVVKRTGSEAIAADRTHYRADIVMNFVVLLALGLTKLTGWGPFDPLFAIGIVSYMLWSAWKVARRAADVLLDRELPSSDRQRIKATVLAHAQARNLHDLRTRYAGDRVFIEFHLEVDGQLTVERGHEIADDVEAAVRAAFPGAEVIAHQEPAGIRDDRLDDRLRPTR